MSSSEKRKTCEQCGHDRPATRVFFPRSGDDLGNICKQCIHENVSQSQQEKHASSNFQLSTYGK